MCIYMSTENIILFHLDQKVSPNIYLDLLVLHCENVRTLHLT